MSKKILISDGVASHIDMTNKAMVSIDNKIEVITIEEAQERGITIIHQSEPHTYEITQPYIEAYIPTEHKDGKQLRRERRKQERKSKK